MRASIKIVIILSVAIILFLSAAILFVLLSGKKCAEVVNSYGESACFKQKFAECKPATIVVRASENLTRYYEILGLKDGLCEVKYKFIANPDPDLVGKEMTCKIEQSKDFEIAVQDIHLCNGDLYDLMIGKVQTSRSTANSLNNISLSAPSSYLLEVDVRIPKEVYKVGESLEGAEYFLKYEGEPFKGRILYTESRFYPAGHMYPDNRTENLYFSTSGTIKTGDFDNKTLPGLKVSMYTVSSNGIPNPFTSAGKYTYTISVYDCASINNVLGRVDCGHASSQNFKEWKELASKIYYEVASLKSKSKNVTVTWS